MSEKYDFEEFKEVLAEKVREHLPEEYQDSSISFHEHTKSGIGSLTGMTVRTPEENLAPCLYIDSAYEEHQKYGIPIDFIAASMAETITDVLTDGIPLMHEDDSLKALINSRFDWNTAKENCYLHAEKVTNNGDFLKNVPHRIQGDIAAVYRIQVGEAVDELATCCITNRMAKQFGVSEETLFQISMKNVMEKRSPHIVSMERVVESIERGENIPLGESFQKELEQIPDAVNDGRRVPYSILTNKDNRCGAALLFSEEVMGSLAKKYPDGFYILPSSIHEAQIVAKMDCTMPLEDLNKLVREVNKEEVAPWDQLSDNVHEYDPVTRSLYIAGTDAPSKNLEEKTQQQKMTDHKRR